MNTDGFLIIDKAEGVTSSYVDKICKRVFRANKIGHIGTLDPFATGVLLIAINAGTKAIPYITTVSKTYEFEVKFGAKTDTGDLTGKVIKSCSKTLSTADIKKVLPNFVGKISQKPHPFSAVKINGARAYTLARRGLVPDIKNREVIIFNLELIGDVRFRAEVSPGTYIRTLVEDIAAALETYAYVVSLRRVIDGKFSLKDAIALDKLEAMPDNIGRFVIPIKDVLDDIPVVFVSEQEAQDLIFGRKIYFESDKSESRYLVSASCGFLGIAEFRKEALSLKRLFIKGEK
ncbi:MAG: tRNA pseudouridine(55) synthase TruB [Holosporales bacterium]|jgi:tRNA pseudouridine55 synthase|nr:tRNA pseudouridine(55) synthase TruB [Holosporales bacterium]